jgi:acyl carrier protein
MQVIHDFMRSEFAPERASFSADENLLATGLIDSIGILKLVTFLEERFGFQADDDDLVPENFMTMKLIRDFVERKKKA